MTEPTNFKGKATGFVNTIQPYLFFRGRCEEAIEYYKNKLGAEVGVLMRFRDNPDKPGRDKVPAELDERIMHADMKIYGAQIMMSDGWKSGPLDFNCMSLALSIDDETEANRLFNALAQDGTVAMPMGPTFFAKAFGSVTDTFGVSWMIMVSPESNR
jgi:PhnB protein